ncbi:MAG: hypothetical protein ACOCUT_03570, partial [bacterium]
VIKEEDNIFAGGDVVRGPSSIIKGIADGKNAAWTILSKEGLEPLAYPLVEKNISIDEIKNKRRHRNYGKGLPHLPISERDNFKTVVQTMSEDQAKAEADRCLLCDEFCEVCVTVCPNRANMFYALEPETFKISNVYIKNGEYTLGPQGEWSVSQKRQILNIGEFCNECGNCATFCPTSGKPYVNKPKLYLTEAAYKNESDNAISLMKNNSEVTLALKTKNAEYQLVGDLINKKYLFQAPQACLELEDDNELKIVKLINVKNDGKIDGELIAKMITLHKHLRGKSFLFREEGF